MNALTVRQIVWELMQMDPDATVVFQVDGRDHWIVGVSAVSERPNTVLADVQPQEQAP